MAVFNINFTVDGESQSITRTSARKIRAGSRNYFYAVFQFLDNKFTELEGLTAVFSGVPSERNRGAAWAVPLEANNGVYAVQIPWEVMTRRGTVYVGIYAGDLLVTNEAEFEVTKAAPTNGGNPLPSQTWLSKLLEMIAGKQDKLTAGENITIDEDNVISATGGGGGSGGGGENEIFDVYYNQTTYSEVAEAYSDGKALRLHYDDALSQTATMWLAYVQGGGRDLPTFYFFGWGDVYNIRRISLTESGWSGALSFGLASSMELANKQDALTAGTGITIAYEGEDLSRVLKISADLQGAVTANGQKAVPSYAIYDFVTDAIDDAIAALPVYDGTVI